MATTPITPTPCNSQETVIRTVDEADIKAVEADEIVSRVIVIADLIDTGAAITCRTVTFVYTGATVVAALAELTAGVNIEDALEQLGIDLTVAFFAGSIPPDDVDALGVDVRETREQEIRQAIRNGLGDAV